MDPRQSPSVFLDSNVIFSGLHSPNGIPSRILQLCVSGRLRLVISQLVIVEVVDNVRIKLPGQLGNLRDFIAESGCLVVDDPSLETVERIARHVNWNDAPIVGAALEIGVDYFVTGDQRLLKELQSLPERVRACSPREFLTDIET